MESISKRPSLRSKWLFLRGKYALATWPSGKARGQHLLCPLHLKGRPSLQDSTSVTQTQIEPTGKRAESCLPATQWTWIFRHQGIWLEKQTNRQDCYTLPLEIKTKQSHWPAWPSCLAAVTLDTESLLYKSRWKQQGKERNIQHGGGQRGGGGRRSKSIFKSFVYVCWFT